MAIKFKLISLKADKTKLVVENSGVLKDSDKITNRKTKDENDMPRHADFDRAFDRMKPHLLIATGFREPTDVNGNFLQSSNFNDFFADSEEEAERFGGLELLSVEVVGKHSADALVLKGTYETPSGDTVPVETPEISLTKGDGYNYPLLSILDVQFEKLVFEAEQYFMEKKHGAGKQLTMGIENEKAKPGKNLAVAE